MIAPVRNTEDWNPTGNSNRTRDAGPIVVAFDCPGPTLAAIHAARQLAATMRRPVRMLSVTESVSRITASRDLVTWPTIPVSNLPGQPAPSFTPVAGQHSPWDLEVDVGNLGSAIARDAREAKASMIVTGIVHNSSAPSLIGGETLIDIAHSSETALLASASLEWKPQRVLVAVDAEIPGLDGMLPGELFSSVSSVYCVHVQPPRTRAMSARSPIPGFDPEREIPGRLRSLMRLPDRAVVQGVTLQGDPAREILDFAERFRIDLIVIGRRSRNAWQRMLSEGVSSRILRRTRCSVLVLPAVVPEGDSSTSTYRNPLEWPQLLSQLTERDAGRKVNIEIVDDTIGAQSEVKSLPLQGLVYDHKDERVEIMLGGFWGSSRHLTHSISGVTSIDLLFGPNGEHKALRIAHDHGQVLISFA